MRTKKTQNLDELREEARKVKEEGEAMMATFKSHFRKMEEYYSDWEDRMNAIQNKVNQAEEEHGISAEKLLEYDLTQDLAALQ